MAVNNQSQYPLRVTGPRARFNKRLRRGIITGVGAAGVLGLFGLFLLPQVITFQAEHEQTQPVPLASTVQPFPVSVDPATKTIINNPTANAFYYAQTSDVAASAFNVSYILDWIATLIDNTRLYQSLGAVDGHLVTIAPGDRKEQVVAQLAEDLNWSPEQQQEFLADAAKNTPGLTEGIFAPGTYVVNNTETPSNVAALMNVAFDKSILVHYSSTTAEQVPLQETLTIASLLEREAAGPTDMRIISGIIWNRLFNNMNLQIDATLQYAKGDTKGNWWSEVVPKDKYISSAYNTYEHPGLPPGPIANPSVAAVLAALNPVKTSCLYYFHDSHGNFHCSNTYEEHVALLKKYYGQGK